MPFPGFLGELFQCFFHPIKIHPKVSKKSSDTKYGLRSKNHFSAVGDGTAPFSDGGEWHRNLSDGARSKVHPPEFQVLPLKADFCKTMDDVFGKALMEYQNGAYSEDIVTFSSLDEEDKMSLPYLFRDFGAMPSLEQRALSLCKGSILDIGCGAGSHSLYLQKEGYKVTALDSSKGAIETCRRRGVEQRIRVDILDFTAETFDTLLMLMNGIGIVGHLNNLGNFLTHLKSLLKPGGQILLDSSDIIYMFEEDDDGGRWVPDSGNYYGEVEFTLQYKDLKSKPFPWLYLDYKTLKNAATLSNLNCKMIEKGDHYDYLARLW